jgi:hypothetical protein
LITTKSHHPVVNRVNAARRADIQLRLADSVTAFAGSMTQAKADHDFVEEDQELKLNTELTREIHDLTRELHTRILGDQDVAVKPPEGHAGSANRLVGRPVRSPTRDRHRGLYCRIASER